jgi:hypothetical protein
MREKNACAAKCIHTGEDYFRPGVVRAGSMLDAAFDRNHLQRGLSCSVRDYLRSTSAIT